MKVFAILAALALAASAVPAPKQLQFRNLFVDPIGGVKNKPGSRIIGGQEATPHSIPYQVFLEVYSGFSGWYCGGSLISANYVLTAGHCGDGGDNADVILGAHRPQESESTQLRLNTRDLTVHPEFDIDLIRNDVAIFKLPQTVEFNDNIKAIALPTLADVSNTYAGATARVSGWGLTDGFGSTISDVLNYLDSTIIDNSECVAVFDIVQDSNVCITGDQSTGSCNGDSGGPLVVDGVQVGVVSFGVRYCLPGYPSAFARVTSFLEWIAENSDIQI